MANEVAATSRKEESSDELLASLAELLDCEDAHPTVEQISAHLVAMVQEREEYKAMVDEVCHELECDEDDLVNEVSGLCERIEDAEAVMETLEVFQSVLGMSDVSLRFIIGSADKTGAMQKEIAFVRGAPVMASMVDPCRSLVSLLVQGLSRDPEAPKTEPPAGQTSLRSV